MSLTLSLTRKIVLKRLVNTNPRPRLKEVEKEREVIIMVKQLDLINNVFKRRDETCRPDSVILYGRVIFNPMEQCQVCYAHRAYKVSLIETFTENCTPTGQ